MLDIAFIFHYNLKYESMLISTWTRQEMALLEFFKKIFLKNDFHNKTANRHSLCGLVWKWKLILSNNFS